MCQANAFSSSGKKLNAEPKIKMFAAENEDAFTILGFTYDG
jgi:hypothetical protein